MDKTLEIILDCIGTKHGAGKELAEYLEISPNVITNWKNGSNKSYRKHLKKLAEYFNVSIDYLLGNEKKPTVQDSEIKDEFIAFYGEVKKDLDENDIADLKTFMRMKAEIKRKSEKK
ncbi:MAG: helix-turn-helix transcriptional regulator [Oscillospiraceae bacterium]